MCIGIRDAVSTLGRKYLECFERDSGLPIEENRNLAAAAGMLAEPLYNPSLDGWIALLRKHGLLWTSYGWQVFDVKGLVETRAGRHIIIIYGMTEDGSITSTRVKYVDPSDGARHEMTLAEFVAQHETGFAMRLLSNRQLGQFSQIMHY
jgi:hypothetical protein